MRHQEEKIPHLVRRYHLAIVCLVAFLLWAIASRFNAASRIRIVIPWQVHASTVDISDDTTVHVVFSNHLDIGFHSNLSDVPGTDLAVIDRYFRHHFPKAISTALDFHDKQQNLSREDWTAWDVDRGSVSSFYGYKYLTHAWLVSLYLDCPVWLGASCPTQQEVEEFKSAVNRGDITWHAMPHNAQVRNASNIFSKPGLHCHISFFQRLLMMKYSIIHQFLSRFFFCNSLFILLLQTSNSDALQIEFFLDPTFLRWSIEGIAHSLDRQFSLPFKRTISQRDVPGLTRAAIPALASAGIQAISVGVNGGSAPPAVPLNSLFWWQDPSSQKKLLAVWHPGGYSGFPVDSAAECLSSPGLNHVLCCAWKGDNEGPHSPDEVVAIFDAVQRQFPMVLRGKIVASDFDAFMREVLEANKAGKLYLPVIEQEIGDTWIHGIATDPVRTSDYRSLLRSWKKEVDLFAASPKCDDTNACHWQRFLTLLAKVPEHTWGTDTKQYPGDYIKWKNSDFHEALCSNDSSFTAAVESWRLQREYNDRALQSIFGSTLYDNAKRDLETLRRDRRPPSVDFLEENFDELSLHDVASMVFQSGDWKFRLSPSTGSLASLTYIGLTDHTVQRSASADGYDGVGIDWTGSNGSLAEVVYSTYDEASFHVLWTEYAYRPSPLPEWFLKDFGKPNVTSLGGATRLDSRPRLHRVFLSKIDSAVMEHLHVIAEVVFDQELVVMAGAPPRAYLEYRILPHSSDLHVDFTWVDKTATRLPEAMWVRWRPGPDATDPKSWRLYKLGELVDPLDVMQNGSMALHAVDDNGVIVMSNSKTRDGRQYKLQIKSLDAALTCVGWPNPLPNVRSPPEVSLGISTCLVNNIWGTNYPMWYPYDDEGRDMRFRFAIESRLVDEEVSLS